MSTIKNRSRKQRQGAAVLPAQAQVQIAKRGAEARAKLGFDPQREEVLQLATEFGDLTGERLNGHGQVFTDVGGADGPAALYELVVEKIRDDLLQRTVKLLRQLFQDGDRVEFAYQSYAGGSFHAKVFTLDDPALLRFLREHFGYANLYFGLHPRKPGAAKRADADDVLAHQLIGIDFDFKGEPGSESEAKWRAELLPKLKAAKPALVLDTGGGFHAHFPVERTEDRGEMNARVGQLGALYGAIGADAAVRDLPRVLRLPYSINVLSPKKRERGRTIRLVRPVV